MMTTRVRAIVLLMLMETACQRSQPLPASPSPITPSSTLLSGIVYESTSSGRRALANVGIDVSVEDHSFPPQTTTDADGHYEVSGASPVAGTGNLKVIATKAGYSQPCRAPVASATNGVLDIYLVSDEILSTTGVPSSMPTRQPTLSGLVFERTPDGNRPIAGATVVGDFSGGWGWAPSAATRSDATGRYMLCGVGNVGDGLDLYIYVASSGYGWVEIPVDVRRTGSFDIELRRQ